MSGLGAGRLILIVEDNEKNMKLARDVLQFHGFRTVETVNGEDAVIMAREHLPDLILMDISLPGAASLAGTKLGVSRGLKVSHAILNGLSGPGDRRPLHFVDGSA